MTKFILRDDNGTEREFDTRSKAQEVKEDLEELGADVDLEPVDGSTTESVATNGESHAESKQTAQEPPQARETNAEVVEARPKEIESEEQFVTEVKGVPEKFVINMGTKDNKSIHIKKEGYYYLASKMGINYGAEPIKTSMELDNEKSIYRGWAEKDGKRWENVGTAHLPGEDMQGAKYNLDELAATRAACRALSMATGTGIASMEEMIDYE